MNPADPCQLADFVLAAVGRGGCDMVFVEPAGDDAGEQYAITCERGIEVVGSIVIDTALASATIARLALIAGLDLAVGHTSGGVVRAMIEDEPAEVVITLRPGSRLRMDVAAMSRKRVSRPTLLAPGVDAGPRQGAVIGSYRVLQRLGEGGMGTVFEVEHVALGNRRAMKVLRIELVDKDPTSGHRFLREARAAARVMHPNIVQVFDFGYLADGRPYFVMELLGGDSLWDVIQAGPLEPSEATAIARQLAGALAAAHEAGVVHADVTPANAHVVSRAPLVVKLLDFGLAELMGEVRPEETSSFVLGTPYYISPEQLRGLPSTDRSDQYSLGVVMFEMITGTPPYVDSDLRKLCLKHINAPVPEVVSPTGPIPTALASAITTCLQKSPQSRFPGMRALIAALDSVEHAVDRRGWRRFLPT